jgi:hypothetical protein
LTPKFENQNSTLIRNAPRKKSSFQKWKQISSTVRRRWPLAGTTSPFRRPPPPIRVVVVVVVVLVVVQVVHTTETFRIATFGLYTCPDVIAGFPPSTYCAKTIDLIAYLQVFSVAAWWQAVLVHLPVHTPNSRDREKMKHYFLLVTSDWSDFEKHTLGEDFLLVDAGRVGR